jgi:MFS transporter, SET family, sugar efflux transporter
VGVFAVLGIIVVAQRLLPEAVATASAVFMSSTATGALGGLIATAGIAVMSRSRHAVS